MPLSCKPLYLWITPFFASHKWKRKLAHISQPSLLRSLSETRAILLQIHWVVTNYHSATTSKVLSIFVSILVKVWKWNVSLFFSPNRLDFPSLYNNTGSLRVEVYSVKRSEPLMNKWSMKKPWHTMSWGGGATGKELVWMEGVWRGGKKRGNWLRYKNVTKKKLFSNSAGPLCDILNEIPDEWTL